MKFLSHPFLRVASFVFTVVSATSAATLSDVSATPLEDGQVRLVYTVDGTADETFRVELSGLNQEDGSDIELKSLSGTDLSQRLSPGTYTNLWDAAADFPTNRTERFVVQATLLGHESATADYVVLDLSTNTYPVSTLDAVPDGGWTDEYKTSKMVFRRIEAGSFSMGSPSGEIGRNKEESASETRHSVTLTEPFYLAVFPCTQGQYRRIAGSNPAKAAQGETLPVDSVSYVTLRGASQGAQWPTSSAVDATSFFGRLNARSGQTFDLPTEVQWEYACRATTTTALNSGKNLSSANQDASMAAVGRYEGNRGGNATAAVGSYAANTWGLYDMHGNVLEWCLDRYSLSMSSSAATDPVGPTSGTLRVCRGGAWSSPASQCRSAARIYAQPSAAGNNYGFRVLCKNAWQDAAPVTLLSAEVTVDTLPPPPPPPPPDPIPLAEAADTTNLVWTSGDWFGQTNVVKVNDSALQSGAIGDNKKSTVSTTVNGAGTLSFWWKTSSHKNDYVKFYVDGAATSKRLSGDSDWAQVTYVVESAAKHTFSWTYEKDSSNTNGMDCAWLDGVVWTPAMSLGEALDCTNLVWTTSGDAPWYGEPNTGAKKDGDLAISGLLGDDGKSILSTTIPEAGTLTFSWKLSKANTFDSISFLVDGNEEDYTDSATWATRSFHFDGGEEVEWNFYKYEADETGAERAYVDDVVWTPDYIPPEPDPIPLAEAADSTNLVWTSSDWFGQTNMVKVNDSALQSGLIGDDGVSTLTTTVNGEGTLTFWWRTSSEETMDRLQFFLDGTGLDSVSGIMSDWEQKTIQVTGETAHTLAWKYMKSSSNTNGQDCAWLDGIAWTPAMSLAEAVDCTNLVWSTDGDAPWFGEPGSSAKSDGDYAIGGILPTNGFSRLSTTVTGPGTLSFSWKVACPAHGDILELRVDDEVKASINGTTANWKTFSFDVAEGDHMVDWIYWKDQADAMGKDRGYVDAVVWSPVLPEPEPEPELPSLTRAVDAINLVLTNANGSAWFVQTEEVHTGDSALQSGAISDGEISMVAASASGPGTLSFWWKVSSEADADKLQFLVREKTFSGVPVDSGDVGYREISGEQDWVQVTLTYTTDVVHSFLWQYNKSAANTDGDDCGWLDDVTWTPDLTLAEALDAPGLPWSPENAAGAWTGEKSKDSAKNDNRAVSGYVEDGETSDLATTFAGSGVLSFSWKVSSTRNADTLYLYVDGEIRRFISGDTGWMLVEEAIAGDGDHTVVWSYEKDETDAEGLDRAYLDNVVWEPKSVLSMAPGPGRLALAPKKAMQTFAFSDIAVNGDGTISVALEADVYGSGVAADGLYAMVKIGLGSSKVYVIPGTLSVPMPPELPVLTFAVPDGVEGLFVVGVCDAEEIELKDYPTL